MRKYLFILVCLMVSATILADDKKKSEDTPVDTQMKHQLDSLTDANAKLQSMLNADSIAIDSLKQANDSLQKELDAMVVFRQEFIKDRLLGQSPDLTLPFSQVPTTEIDSYLNKLKPYEGIEEIDKKIEEVNHFKKYQTLYVTYSLPLKMPFSRQAISDTFNDITKNLKTKVDTDLNEAQYKEFDQIAVYLSRYYQGCKDFQTLIKSVESKLKSYMGNTDDATREFCIQQAQKVLEENKETIEKRIMKIDYLRERFETYNQGLMSNPLKLSQETQQAVQEINHLKLD